MAQPLAGLDRRDPGRPMITYEDLRAETPRVLGRATDLIGWQCSETELEAAVDFVEFDKLKVLEKEKFFQSRRIQPRNDPGDCGQFILLNSL